jgi:uncharacterized protein
VDQILTDTEVRVLGSLVEKEITTPDYYPLSLNALLAACNQELAHCPRISLRKLMSGAIIYEAVDP